MEEAHKNILEEAIIEDEIFAAYGIEEDELQAAMLHYDLMNDPEKIKKLKENMQKL